MISCEASLGERVAVGGTVPVGVARPDDPEWEALVTEDSVIGWT
jgi:hypothetical protein